LTQLNGFRGHFDSVDGQRLLAASLPAGLTAPTDVLVRPPSKASQAIQAALKTPGVQELTTNPEPHDGWVKFSVALSQDPYNGAARATVVDLRNRVHAVAPEALVGGATAIDLDSRVASVHDESLVIPLVLIVVLVILGVLLRAVVAPLMLIATVILSFLAAFGVSIVIFDWVFHFAGIDPGLPLYAFIFMVALGVDYNIFLMARVREESAAHGTHAGVLIGLAATGGVITSAGMVLAGTFSALAVIPLVFLTEIGFMVAFGVLLDTTVVRSTLVPALTLDLGDRVWWPRHRHAAPRPSGEERAAGAPERAPAPS
jgi:RND superfamily putative drug exporter